MHSVVAIFPTPEAAAKAANSLDLPGDRVSVVAPGPLKPEDEGIGPALGGVVGGAIGAAAGSSLGAAAASLMVPGVGAVVATGVVGALLLGAGGAVAGAAAGEKAEEAAERPPTDDPRDLFFYHAALRRGRAIVLALAETKEEADSLQRKLAGEGGQDLDTEREAWWSGLREGERAAYQGNFIDDEEEYRRGFEAALEPRNREKPLREDAEVSNAYRNGYERGYEYLRKVSGEPVSPEL
jgi:hypothetical protein